MRWKKMHMLILVFLQPVTLLLVGCLICAEGLVSFSSQQNTSFNGNTTTTRGAFGNCNGCYCVPDNGTNKTCPTETQPSMEFSKELLTRFKSFQWMNPLTLRCDPYRRNQCDTEEYSVLAQELDTNSSCCVIDFYNNTSITSYKTRTFNGTISEAFELGLYVTHDGSCGLCSSMQDLAVFMETVETMKEKASRCGFIGVFGGKAAGVRCFRKIGLSKGCSTVWFYNTKRTRTACPQCFRDVLSSNKPNGPPPRCDLSDCIQCDETKSGPTFLLFSGRTRRNSGLLTDIVRNCSEITRLTHLDPLIQNNEE